jgi:hypothetical protein
MYTSTLGVLSTEFFVAITPFGPEFLEKTLTLFLDENILVLMK